MVGSLFSLLWEAIVEVEGMHTLIWNFVLKEFLILKLSAYMANFNESCPCDE